MTLLDLLNSTIPIIIVDDYRTYPYLINNNNSVELLDERGYGAYILPNQEVVLDANGMMLFEVGDNEPLYFHLLVTKPLTNEMILLCAVGIEPEDL